VFSRERRCLFDICLFVSLLFIFAGCLLLLVLKLKIFNIERKKKKKKKRLSAPRVELGTSCVPIEETYVSILL